MFTPMALQQMWNQAIILCAGPADLLDVGTALQINGLTVSDQSFFNGVTAQGIQIDPDQTKAAAITGTFGADSNVPSVSLYDGAYDIEVPVDIRAEYDRNFPLYGFSGCSYLVLRFANATARCPL